MLNRIRTPSYSNPKTLHLDYKDFKGGLNSLFRQTEVRANELCRADNLLLIGSGIPTKRWGSQNYNLAGATGYGRGLFSVKSALGTIELLSLTDAGIFTKQNGASYTPITGASWASGYNLEGIQLNNNLYLVSPQREMIRYDFSTLVSFTTLAVPGGVAITNISGATGATTYGWRISATSQVGETLGSTVISGASLPQDLKTTLVRVTWTPVSAASGLLTGYNVYRGILGDEVFVGNVDNLTTRFDDFGQAGSLLRQPPTADTTGGPKAKFMARFQDRLVLAGLPGEPTKVLISGRVPNQERFDWAGGGGYVNVDPDTGDYITGLSVHQGRIIVFKENSVWEVKLTNTTIGNFLVLEPTYQLITASQGCSSHRSIMAVDNDLFFLSRKGVYVLGYEPNITGDVLRTNELSAKIRPFFESITDTDFSNATSIYFDYKYVLAFPNAKKCVVFDKERLAWMGPWTTTFGINKFVRHVDTTGIERLLCIDADDSYVSEFSKSLVDDKGTPFRTVLLTKKDDYGDWKTMKTIEDLFFEFRNVIGNVNINVFLEELSGQTISGKTFGINAQTANSGWGTDMWGTTQWGLSENAAQASSEELIRRVYIYETARTTQVEITTSDKVDNYEFLGMQAQAFPQGPASSPYTWDVT